MNKKHSINEVSKIDKEVRKLSSLYSETRIKVGFELAQRLTEMEEGKLYLKLDEKAYPNFSRYIESLNLNYKSIREIMGLFLTYVVVAGFSIKELSEIPYHKLTILKSHLFQKKDGKYKLIKPLSEVKKWVKEAGSDLSIEDLKIKKEEEKVGPHRHDWQHFKRCRLCKIKEFNN